MLILKQTALTLVMTAVHRHHAHSFVYVLEGSIVPEH